MNNIIPFKKSIIFKTKIAEITDISLTHDYKIPEDMIEGEFYLSGTYKMTEASVIDEEFYYNIPFSVALGERIKKESINLVLDDFKYSFKDDTLIINIDLNMEYEEEVLEDRAMSEVTNEVDEVEEPKVEEEIIEEASITGVESEVDNNTINNLLSNVNNTNEFTTYKVHIVRNDDTFESIASKYNVSLNNIKEYNKNETLNVGDKILVPFIYNE